MPIHLPPLSRRQFLAGTFAAGASALLRARAFAAAREIDPHGWALISDPHIAADRAKIARNINMAQQLAGIVDDVLKQPKLPVAAIVNGDLAFNSGEAADYGTFVELIAPLRAARIPLHLALGNHDNRERFWAAIPTGDPAWRPVADRQVSIVKAPRANWFILDSLDKTNSTPGLLGAPQLEWLAKSLDANADKPAIVLTHHNPALETKKVNIIDEAALFAVLRPRRQVKAYMFGHSHRWSIEKDESGVHLINLPTTAYPFEAGQPIAWVNTQLRPDGIDVQLRCLDTTRPDHGRTTSLGWRT